MSDDVLEPDDADDEAVHVPVELVELHEILEMKAALDAETSPG